MPKLANKCIKSWKKHCPDYEIIEWNEDNFDISACPLYVRQAYEMKKWAFVTDYVRLKVVYDHGGIYMDTDVELLKNLDFLLDYDAYFGFEEGKFVNTGVGFGAIQSCPVLAEMMEDYKEIPFIMPDGSMDTKTCPQRNTSVLLMRGLEQNNTRQILEGNILILPSVCMCPISYFDGKNGKTSETVSIHWFSASWQTLEQQKKHKQNLQNQKRAECIHNIVHLPNRILRAVLGTDCYEKLKRRLKR